MSTDKTPLLHVQSSLRKQQNEIKSGETYEHISNQKCESTKKGPKCTKLVKRFTCARMVTKSYTYMVCMSCTNPLIRDIIFSKLQNPKEL